MRAARVDWPIVVFGAPRSGTTYVNTVLNTHPQVHVTHESRIFSWMTEALNGLPNQDRLVKSHRVDFMPYLAERLPDLVRDFYVRLRPNSVYWGDKNPHYAASSDAGVLDAVARLFPGARFVHVMRDGRDVVSSLVRKTDPEGVPWTTFDAANRIWMEHVDNATAFCEGRADCFEIRFEVLVEDDLAVVERLFRFLDIEMAAETVDFCTQQQADRTPVGDVTSEGLGVPQWQQALSVEEQIQCLRLIGPHLIRYGYETEESLAALWGAIADLG